MDFLPPIGVLTTGAMNPWSLPVAVYAILAGLMAVIAGLLWAMPAAADAQVRRVWCPSLGREAEVVLRRAACGGAVQLDGCSLRRSPEFRVCDRRCLDAG